MGNPSNRDLYMVKSCQNPTTNEGLHGKFIGNPATTNVHIRKSRENHTKTDAYMVKSWGNPTTNEGLHGKFMGKPSNNKCSHKKITGKPYKNRCLHGKIMRKPNDKWRFTWEIHGKPIKNRCSHGKIMGKPNKDPPACRRVLWILLVRSCTVCFVFVLSRLSPWRGFLPRLTWTHPAVISMVVSVIFVFAIDHRFAPSLLISNTWSTGFCAEHLLHA